MCECVFVREKGTDRHRDGDRQVEFMQKLSGKKSLFYMVGTQSRKSKSGCFVKCYVFFPTEGYGGNLNFEKNEKE